MLRYVEMGFIVVTAWVTLRKWFNTSQVDVAMVEDAAATGKPETAVDVIQRVKQRNSKINDTVISSKLDAVTKDSIVDACNKQHEDQYAPSGPIIEGVYFDGKYD